MGQYTYYYPIIKGICLYIKGLQRAKKSTYFDWSYGNCGIFAIWKKYKIEYSTF